MSTSPIFTAKQAFERIIHVLRNRTTSHSLTMSHLANEKAFELRQEAEIRANECRVITDQINKMMVESAEQLKNIGTSDHLSVDQLHLAVEYYEDLARKLSMFNPRYEATVFDLRARAQICRDQLAAHQEKP